MAKTKQYSEVIKAYKDKYANLVKSYSFGLGASLS